MSFSGLITRNLFLYISFEFFCASRNTLLDELYTHVGVCVRVCLVNMILNFYRFWNLIGILQCGIFFSFFVCRSRCASNLYIIRSCKVSNEQTSPFSNKIQHVLAHESHTQGIATHTLKHIHSHSFNITRYNFFFARIFFAYFFNKMRQFFISTRSTHRAKKTDIRTHIFDVKDESTPQVSESVTKME